MRCGRGPGEPPRVQEGAVLVRIAVHGTKRAPRTAKVVESPIREPGREPRLNPRIENPVALGPVIAGAPLDLSGALEVGPCLADASLADT